MKVPVYILLVAFFRHCAIASTGDEEEFGSGEFTKNSWSVLGENEIDQDFDTRISGGMNVSIVKFPFMASILVNNTLKGGAIILNRRWLVIGAYSAKFAHHPSDMTVRVGSSSSYNGGLACEVKNIVLHPNAQGYDNDIALVQLKHALPNKNKLIKPIKISDKLPKTGAKVLFTGFGWFRNVDVGSLQENGEGALRETLLHFLEYKKCHPYYFNTLSFTKRCFCTGVSNTTSPESADFGSPLIFRKKVIGTFSGLPCGKPKKPAVFVDLTKERSWIFRTMKKYSNQE